MGDRDFFDMYLDLMQWVSSHFYDRVPGTKQAGHAAELLSVYGFILGIVLFIITVVYHFDAVMSKKKIAKIEKVGWGMVTTFVVAVFAPVVGVVGGVLVVVLIDVIAYYWTYLLGACLVAGPLLIFVGRLSKK